MAAAAIATAPEPLDAPPRLGDRAVRCAAWGTASVPVYRQLVERSGERFLHRDGGHQDGSPRLDATPRAAGRVICQTGCICHDAS